LEEDVQFLEAKNHLYTLLTALDDIHVMKCCVPPWWVGIVLFCRISMFYGQGVQKRHPISNPWEREKQLECSLLFSF
jgi:hypothetical protein